MECTLNSSPDFPMQNSASLCITWSLAICSSNILQFTVLCCLHKEKLGYFHSELQISPSFDCMNRLNSSLNHEKICTGIFPCTCAFNLELSQSD